MDPLSIIAISGLIYAGKVLCEKKENFAPNLPTAVGTQGEVFEDGPIQQADYDVAQQHYLAQDSMAQEINRNTNPNLLPPKQETGSFATVAPTSGRNPSGQPVYNYYDRQDVSGKMNSVQPMEKQYVGPGLGIGPAIPAYGGFQQLYRTMPNNVNGYKLNTLPGRTGPAGSFVSKPSQVGQVIHNKPATTAAQWSRRPPVRGRAEGQGGALTGQTGHQNFEKTKRQTNRSVTTTRDDGLQYGPAKDIVPMPSVQDNPTRNKGDRNEFQRNFLGPAAPGITNFEGGYEVAPTNIRPSVFRGQKDREGNAGRMNVRGDALQAGGALTQVKDMATTVVQGQPAPTTAQNQTYVQDKYYQTNSYKGNKDPRSCNLKLAANVLKKNPLAHHLYGK